MKRKDGDIIRRNEKIKEIFTCDECFGERKNINGTITCIRCGLQSPYVHYVAELDLNSWKKKKSVHKRNKWFAKKLHGVVKNIYTYGLIGEFMMVVKLLMKYEMIKKNVSRYNYYILRLCSLRKIPFLPGIKLNDMKKGKTKKRFDNNLFGIIYKELGWKKTAKRNCYYKKWLKEKE